MLSLTQALAARRAMLATAALAATLGAHAVAAGGIDLTPTAPLTWGWLVIAAVLFGPRRAPWRTRGPATIVMLLALWQVALHLAMSYAPWLFGVSVHHQGPLLTPAGLAAHVGAALLLSLLLARGERLLAGALVAAAAVLRLVAPPRPRRRISLPVPAAPPRAVPAPAPRAVSCRGPPRAAVA